MLRVSVKFQFNQILNPAGIGTFPFVRGANNPSTPGIESNLDVQYSMSLANGTRTEFWEFADPNADMSTWTALIANLTDQQLPLVHSISYGWDERVYTRQWLLRVDLEFIKVTHYITSHHIIPYSH